MSNEGNISNVLTHAHDVIYGSTSPGTSLGHESEMLVHIVELMKKMDARLGLIETHVKKN